MERILTNEVRGKIGERVLIKGSLHKVRDLGGVCFGVVRDRSGLMQIVTEDINSELTRLKKESIIEVEGLVVENQEAPGGLEVKIEKIQVLVEVKEDLPLEIDKLMIKSHLDKILDHRPISLRNLRNRSIFRIQAVILKAFRDYFSGEGFTEINSSKIIGAATEGGANVFEIDYFEQKAFLAQSPQFYKQIMIGSFERVFETNFVYRAEPSNTSRHITEYMSLDMEMGYIDSVLDVVEAEIGFLRKTMEYLKEFCADDLKLLEIDLPVLSEKIPVIKFAEVLAILAKNYGRKDEGGIDLDAQDEKNLGDWAKKEHKSDFVFVTYYPTVNRPFYTMVSEENREESCSFDLLFKGLEITSGAQREHRYEKLIENMLAKGLKPEQFDDYLMAFKYGLPPHGGLGIGLERLTAQLLNLENVREATLLPRDMGRVRP